MAENTDSSVQITEFKGHPVFNILHGKYKTKDGEERENSFSFGKKKAELILKHIEEIKLFVNGGELPAEDIPAESAAAGQSSEDDELPFN